jgi:hypothetical protein
VNFGIKHLRNLQIIVGQDIFGPTGKKVSSQIYPEVGEVGTQHIATCKKIKY